MLKEKFHKQNYSINFTDEDFEYFRLVRDNYLNELLEKAQTLEMDLEDVIRLDENEEELLYRCNRTAHSIKGTGYSFGFKFISEVAFCIEELLDILLEHKLFDKKNKFAEFGQKFNDILIESIKYFLENIEVFEIPENYKQNLYNLMDIFDFYYSKINTPKETKKNTEKKISIDQKKRKKTNILFCENNKMFEHQILKILKDKDFEYSIVCTMTFEEAIKELQKNSFDIIFCTFYLKNFTALSFYKAIKHSIRYKTIPFYFLCTNIHQELIDNNIDKKYIIKKDVKYLYSIINAIVEL